MSINTKNMSTDSKYTRYVTKGGERLQDIAKKTGIDYDRLAEYNPQYVGKRIGKNAYVVLRDMTETGVEEKMDEKEAFIRNALKDAEKTRSEAETDSGEDGKEAEEQRKKQLKIEQYNDNIGNAEQDYAQDFESARQDLLLRSKKLAHTLYNNRASLESDLAKQKISESSIAHNSRENLEAEAADSRAEAERAFNEKARKLKNTLARKRAEQERKIASLS